MTRAERHLLERVRVFERYTHSYQLAGAYGNEALGSEASREARYPLLALSAIPQCI